MGRFLAHITTLSSGSIVVLATFAESFSGKGPAWLLAVSAVGFALANLASPGCTAVKRSHLRNSLGSHRATVSRPRQRAERVSVRAVRRRDLDPLG